MYIHTLFFFFTREKTEPSDCYRTTWKLVYRQTWRLRETKVFFSAVNNNNMKIHCPKNQHLTLIKFLFNSRNVISGKSCVQWAVRKPLTSHWTVNKRMSTSWDMALEALPSIAMNEGTFIFGNICSMGSFLTRQLTSTSSCLYLAGWLGNSARCNGWQVTEPPAKQQTS